MNKIDNVNGPSPKGKSGAYCGLLAVFLLLFVSPVDAQPAERDPDHFIFFGLERDRIREASFLESPGIAGAQLKYTWRELEPVEGAYAFDSLRADLEFLEARGRRLFVQVQDVSFDSAIVNVPRYLMEKSRYGGGVARTYAIEGDDEFTARGDGWVARRWDPAVRVRFIAMLRALGRAFDGRLEGINLAETAIDFGESGALHPEGFTFEGYAESIREIMSAAREAFPGSHVIQYANFMPGEWLPWTDNGYLRGVYAHAEALGVGVGGPDLLPHRPGQRNHSYPLISERSPAVVAGVAVQDGNLEAVDPATGRPVTVGELARFAVDDLHLDYIFWGTQEPFYTEEILPWLSERANLGGSRH